MSVGFDHIVVDDQGVARIAGTRFKVTHLVVERDVHGWGPEELQEQHPHLTLAQIYAAFAYYFDHKHELDRQIEEADRFAEEMQRKAGESPIVKKLKALGKLP